MALLTGDPPNDSEQRTSVDFNNTISCMNHKTKWEYSCTPETSKISEASVPSRQHELSGD